AAAAAMGDIWDGLPADAFVEILRRLQPPISTRARLRLVCRRWRDAIDERAPVRRAPATVLAFFPGDPWRRSRAYIFNEHDLSGDRVRELDLGANAGGASLAGTCNGLICLRCERGGVAVLDTLRRKQLLVGPPLATGSSARYESTYSFAYHATTGQYKILHVPCYGAARRLEAVHVFTLGGEAFEWRQVPVPAGSSCCLHFGLLTIKGVTYWVTTDAERIVSFDHGDERVALVETTLLPALLWTGSYTCHLADVSGKLGIAVCRPRAWTESADTELWVLEGEGEEERVWVKRYMVMSHGKTPCQQIALPRVVHGEHILTTGRPLKPGWQRRPLCFYANQPRHETKLRCGVVRVSARSPGREVREFDGESLQTFAYFETWEHLPAGATTYEPTIKPVLTSSDDDHHGSSNVDDHI
ncbi:hypothetical protein EJB05_35377, partial [Eragrostis curvula]